MSETPAEPPWLQGGCHCGAVRFRARVRSYEGVECNCSICCMKGYLHLLVHEDDFELQSGSEKLSTYTFGTHTAKHHFCSRCGIHSFYRPRSHPDKISVNIRCLKNVNPSAFELMQFDGRNWHGNIEKLRP
jgi:hypothetical protein